MAIQRIVVKRPYRVPFRYLTAFEHMLSRRWRTFQRLGRRGERVRGFQVAPWLQKCCMILCKVYVRLPITQNVPNHDGEDMINLRTLPSISL